MSHACKAFVVTCIDFRFQKFIESWVNTEIGPGNYDRVSWAGGVIDLFGILKQIDISVRLHHIQEVILVNHEDCGAYGPAGTPEKHREDLFAARRAILALYPHLKIRLYYLLLDGTFTAIK